MQQREFDFDEKSWFKKRLIKETVIKYYEETDSEGNRRVHKEKTERKWFDENSGSKHNPTISHHSEYL